MDSQSATPVKISNLENMVGRGTPSKGKAGRGQKVKNQTPHTGRDQRGQKGSSVRAEEQDLHSRSGRTANRSIYGFAQFLRHSAASPSSASPMLATREESQDMGDRLAQPGVSTNQPPYQPFLVVSDDPDSERNASGNSQPIPTITLEQPCDTEMDIFYTQ